MLPLLCHEKRLSDFRMRYRYEVYDELIVYDMKLDRTENGGKISLG